MAHITTGYSWTQGQWNQGSSPAQILMCPWSLLPPGEASLALLPHKSNFLPILEPILESRTLVIKKAGPWDVPEVSGPMARTSWEA